MAQIEDVETARTMAGLETEARLAKANLVAFRRNVYDRLAAEADDRDWCDEWQDVALDMGLGEFLPKSYNVTVELTFQVIIKGVPDVDNVDQEAVDDAARAFIRNTLTPDHWHIVERVEV